MEQIITNNTTQKSKPAFIAGVLTADQTNIIHDFAEQQLASSSSYGAVSRENTSTRQYEYPSFKTVLGNSSQLATLNTDERTLR